MRNHGGWGSLPTPKPEGGRAYTLGSRACIHTYIGQGRRVPIIKVMSECAVIDDSTLRAWGWGRHSGCEVEADREGHLGPASASCGTNVTNVALTPEDTSSPK
jgi:hypothetical protein